MLHQMKLQPEYFNYVKNSVHIFFSLIWFKVKLESYIFM